MDDHSNPYAAPATIEPASHVGWPRSAWISLTTFATPFVAYFPYRWFVFVYARDTICTEGSGRDFQNMVLSIFWFMTFGAIAILLWGCSLGAFFWYRRQHTNQDVSR